MIATCPHCQSGFYIATDLAGKVVTCSKCKKQVRVPGRPGFALSELPNDGIPVAFLAESRVEVEERLKNETEGRFETEKKLKEALEAQAKAEQQLQEEIKARAEAENQAKMEQQAKRGLQSQIEEGLKARKKAEDAFKRIEAQLSNAVAPVIKEPVDFVKGLRRLTVVLSFVTAWLGGWFAYQNGYIIWGRFGFDRPVSLPLFSGPVYLPIVLIVFCVVGFTAAWVVCLVTVFVIRGFRKPTIIIKEARRDSQGPQPTAEQLNFQLSKP